MSIEPYVPETKEELYQQMDEAEEKVDFKELIHMQQEAMKEMALDINRLRASHYRDQADQWRMIHDLIKEVKTLEGNLQKHMEDA